MNAIRFHSFGGTDVLRYEDVPKPTISPTEVLIQLKAAALNHLDIWVRSGARERKIPLPHIPGSDGAGVVAEVGSAVDFLTVGARVLISPGISCGRCEHCLAGRDNLCSTYHVLGTLEDGTYAEYVKIPAINTVPIPLRKVRKDSFGESFGQSGMSVRSVSPNGLLRRTPSETPTEDFQQAAAVPLVFLTAWHMLVTLAQVRHGETVLIHGAGSGVGSAGIQIAKMLGAKVITTVGTNDKRAKSKDLGADDVINYREQDFVEEVRLLTEKRGVDVVFEHVGGEVFEKSLTVIRKGGRLVTCGATTEYLGKIDLRYVYSRHLTILGSFMGTKRELLDVLQFFSNGKLRPVIDSVFPLEQAAEAQKRMEERKQFGKIVLTM